MPGFRHSPAEDIQRIRQDLRDRYHEGFPILKELLQNADDAGAGRPDATASRCVIVLCKNGLAGATHTLLRSSGLCLINDGSFTAEDANSITSLGLSNKAGQAGAAGKFGLGLKSIFHWAEAFFYFSPHSFKGDFKAQSPGYDLLNPWWSRYSEEGHHREWDVQWQQTRDADFRAFSSLVSAMSISGRWFGLWIPLRSRAHTKDGLGTVQPIENRLPVATFDELLGDDWQRRLAETLPLLRRVRSVRICESLMDDWKTVEEMRVGDSAQRMSFGTEPHGELHRHSIELSGKIEDTGRPSAVVFRGTEYWSTFPPLTQLQNHPKWPNQSTLGHDGADRQVREKAEPHGAVIFTRQDTAGQPELRLHQAVFLPLGEPEPIPCAGTWRYNLYLHGFFFVDSGRRGIQPFDKLREGITPDNAESESEVIQLWNRTLLYEVVAPLVLPSLAAFVQQEQIRPDDIEPLVRSLMMSKTLKGLTDWMCCGQRFIHRLTQCGSMWTLDAWTATGGAAPSWVRLPEPDFLESELFELLPTLGQLCGDASVSFDGKPSLAHGAPRKPSEEELAGLLGAVAATAFQNPPHLAYLLKLIPKTVSHGAPDSPLTKSLVKLTNRLLNHPLPADNESAQLWREFFMLLPAGATVRLPVASTNVAPEIASILAATELPVALLWDDFRDVTETGCISFFSVLPILERLSELRLKTASDIEQRAAIAVRLLETCREQPAEWTPQISNLLVFAAHEPDKEAQAASFGQLHAQKSSGRLFAGGEAWARELVKAAPTLKPLIITQPLADVLGLKAIACGPADCIWLLRTAARLNDSFLGRKALFDRLLKGASPNDADTWTALRCLIHGQVSQWENGAALLNESGAKDVFAKLARIAVSAADQKWRLISARIADQLALTAEQRQCLNVNPVSPEVLEKLIKEIGADSVDCAALSNDECDELLLTLDDPEVLRGLNIHETVADERVSIHRHTYVNDADFDGLPSEFNTVVMRLRDRAGYSRKFTTAGTTSRIVEKLDCESVIRIALEQAKPARWWKEILTAIGRLGNLRVELRERVREVTWLPQSNGSAIAPAILLHVPSAEAELDKLPDEILAGRIPLLRLAESVRNHERFETFKSTILPPAKDALVTLTTLLSPHAGWSTGLSGEWSADDMRDWVEALAGAPGDALPLARLTKALASNEEVRDSLPTFLGGLGGTLKAAAYTAVLKHLAISYEKTDPETQTVCLRIMGRYLKGIGEGGVDFARGILASAGVKLVSAEGRTKPPGQLTFANANIHPDDQLDKALSHTLKFLKPARFVFQEVPGTAPVETSSTRKELVQELRGYFAPWRAGITASDPIGALLCLLGSWPGLLDLSREFFSPWSPDQVLDWIDAHDEAQASLGSIRDRINRRQFKVSIVADSEALVRSLLGNEFRARLAIRPTSLLIGYDGDSIETWQEAGRNICHLRLRKLSIERENLTDEVLVSLLRETAATILTQALRAVVDVRPLFEELSKAMQLHVCVAQNMIVDHAPAFLRQVGAQEHPKVMDALAKWDDARREDAVEDAHQLSSRRSSELRREARGTIRNLLSGDAEVQATVLRGVQRKLSGYQYAPASIPFELWQNADDAVVELDRLGIDPGQAADFGFLANESGGNLIFVHWGRLINEFAGSDGKNCRDAGFDRDLEKMLVQAISDKSDASRHGGGALTGKFGLGFKSVFLASDAPEILSASVDFVIRGGIYPVRLEDAQRNELLASLVAVAPNYARRGTVIRLPLRMANADGVLGLFRQLAPVLVIFSRRLKRLRFLEEGNEQREFQWQPKTLRGGLSEFGKLSEPLGEVTGALTLLSALDAGGDRSTFLLGLNHDGFVSFPSHVPVFWVTAPTRDTSGYGFAVNGPFEPDIGRVQLALESEKNRRLARDLSEVLSTRLATLWQGADADWEAFRQELDLGCNTSCNTVWESLWQVLGVHFLEKCRMDDKSVVAELARCVLWRSDFTGMRHFYTVCAALPTGLWGEHRALTKLGNIGFVAAGAFDRESVFRVVSGWNGFQQRVAVGAICSKSQVALVLERLGVPLREAETAHLATVVEWELGNEKRADPELAAYLGELIKPEFMTGLEKGQAGEREESEHRRLIELLRDVSFQAADGSWHEANELVVAASVTSVGEVEDEVKRAAFAPRESQLNSAYTGTALQFFFASRARLEAGVEQMADWVLKLTDEETRVAALRYLLNGELKDRLAKELRGRKDDNNWLWQLADFSWFEARFTDDEQHQIRAYILQLFDDELRQQTLPPPVPPPQPGPEPVHVWTVEELWKWWEQQSKPMDEYTLEGEANWPLFHGGPIGSTEERREELKRLLRSNAPAERNPLWYRLFGYACLVSAGRHTTELRRFWKERLNPRQFWERTSRGGFSEETQEIFEEAVTAQFSEAAYYWRRVFYDLRKVHRMVWVNDFPSDLMRLVDEGHGQHLREFLSSGRLPGPDQQRWVGTFGQSSDTPLGFIIRELVRLEAITDDAVQSSAFFVCRPVLRALAKIGWIPDDESGFSGEQWLVKLAEDPAHGPLLLPYYDIPLLHMGITHRGDRMPVPPH